MGVVSWESPSPSCGPSWSVVAVVEAKFDDPSFRGTGQYEMVISCFEDTSRRADNRRSAKAVRNMSHEA
jgi:hypothetical protein